MKFTVTRSMPAMWKCIQCGECCKHLVGRRFGMAITPAEKTRLETLARRRGITVNFQPLTWNGYKVTLYQFATSICPFLDKNTNRCRIYEWRPLACKAYPLHPLGVSDCTALDQLQRRGFRVTFPPHLYVAAKKYLVSVMPLIRGAVKRYNLNRGWELNVPFQLKYRPTFGRSL